MSSEPTIFDVAAVAGVSKSTVSNVVRGADEVSEPTRARVLEAISRLNYKPNAIARQFVKQRSTMIGVLVGDLDNPYYAQMSRVIERAAFRLGYTAMFCNIEGDDDLAVAGVEALLEQRVAGVVFLAFIERTPELEGSLRQAGIPIVFVGLHERWGDSVGPRDSEGGRLATNHCWSLVTGGSPTCGRPLVDPSGDRARLRGLPSRDEVGLCHVLPAALGWQPGAESFRVGRATVPFEQALRGAGCADRAVRLQRHRGDLADRGVRITRNASAV